MERFRETPTTGYNLLKELVMRWTEMVSVVCGLGIGLFGWVMIAGAMLAVGKADGLWELVAVALLLGVMPVVGGFLLIRTPFRRRARRREEVVERKILTMADASDGRLTPALVAKSTKLTLDEAKAILDEMLLDGHCVSDLQEDGQVVYRF